MMFQRAKPKYTSFYLSLFNVNNRMKSVALQVVKGMFMCIAYHLGSSLVHVTSSKSSMRSYST